MSGETAAQIENRLSHEREKLARLSEAANRTQAASEAATPGGLTGYDPAVLSGIRRKRNRKADDRRIAAYDRQSAARRAVTDQEQVVASLERRLKQAEADAAAPCDLDTLEPGWYVRDRYGWNRVVRANKKSVSVETGYSWSERIALSRIVETRPPSEMGS